MHLKKFHYFLAEKVVKFFGFLVFIYICLENHLVFARISEKSSETFLKNKFLYIV